MYMYGSYSHCRYRREMSVTVSHLWKRLATSIRSKIKEGSLIHSQTDVSYSCVRPVIDHQFRHNIGKVAVNPRGQSLAIT